MLLCEAYIKVNNKGITPWMAWGIKKYNDGYSIVDTQFIKKFKEECIYIKSGQLFPGEPVFSRKIN